jgi:SAM-dependent methyltransferase
MEHTGHVRDDEHRLRDAAELRRNFARPLPFGAPVPFQGRVRECASLIHPANRLLDIGCSSGWLAPLVMGKVSEYVGLDRAVGTGDGIDSRITLVPGSALELPFEADQFDSACLFDVIEHLPKGTELTALQEAHRVLRTGGRLYLSTPHASWLHTPLDPVWLFGHRHYRRKTVRSLLNTAGFEIDRLFVAGGAVEGLDHLRLLAYKHLLKREWPQIGLVTKLIDRAHGTDRRLGLTIFAVGSKRALA